MRNRSSVLTEKQRGELIVENFVYHIIRTDQDEPEYLDEVVLSSEEQKRFFRDIIAETGQGTQYAFLDRKTSTIVQICKPILENPDNNFIDQSRQLAASFLSYHSGGQTSNGVFIVARATVPDGTSRKSLLAVIKLDYSPVLRQRRLSGKLARVSLEEIVEALSEQKSSVQKRALIDLEENDNWDILAVERKKTGSVLDTEDAITDYFKRFLGVKLRENSSSITKRMVTECHRWAKSYDGDLDGRTPADVRHSLISLMDAYEDGELSYDEVKDRVCRHKNPELVKRMRRSFDNHMDESGLSGVTFSPKPNSIQKSSRKGKWETDTGIQVIWQGERNPNLLDKEKQADGSYIITIKANDISEND